MDLEHLSSWFSSSQDPASGGEGPGRGHQDPVWTVHLQHQRSSQTADGRDGAAPPAGAGPVQGLAAPKVMPAAASVSIKGVWN